MLLARIAVLDRRSLPISDDGFEDIVSRLRAPEPRKLRLSFPHGSAPGSAPYTCDAAVVSAKSEDGRIYVLVELDDTAAALLDAKVACSDMCFIPPVFPVPAETQG